MIKPVIILKFDEDTATAIDNSIKKWEGVLQGAEENGASDCSLCALFNNDDTAMDDTCCEYCPIAIHTRLTKKECGYGCRETPYARWFDVTKKFNISSIDYAETDLQREKMIEAAREELDFLHEVKAWYHANAKKES